MSKSGASVTYSQAARFDSESLAKYQNGHDGSTMGEEEPVPITDRQIVSQSFSKPRERM
jgi:hypothetical protein